MGGRAGLCGAGERLHAEIDVAAAHAERLVAKWGPDGPADALPKEIAHGWSTARQNDIDAFRFMAANKEPLLNLV